MAELISTRSIPAAAWMRRLALAAVLLCFGVVVLGAYVRLTAAGLGCPDWPGCYGHLTPAGAEASLAQGTLLPGPPLNETKAWHEMIHRYAASTLGFLILLLAALGIASRRESPGRARYAAALLGIVVVQGALGMLTVTWKLRPLIVSLHLLFGMTTLALLWWLLLSLRSQWRAPALASTRPASAARRLDAGRHDAGRRSWVWARRLAILALVVVAVQIALGGWTSSNYAAIACPDFPTCQGSWWPPMDFRHAFVLWHAPDIDYQGGILTNAARMAIHFTHRMGAVVTTCVLLIAAFAARRQRGLQRPRIVAWFVVAALALQLAIGISMVLRGFPLWLATAHNGGAALTLLAVVALVQSLRPSA
ncbi:MAG: COX15/CtaA family protein, partial [Steroidobacteraceae bacterium]